MLTAPSTSAPTSAPKAIAINLVIFFAFALAALVLLTHTVVHIADVRAEVAEAVTPETRGIAADTALLPQLSRTNQLTVQLAIASRGAGSSLSDTAEATQDIDATILQVRARSNDIAQSVNGISASAATVDRRLADLESDITSIRDSAAHTSASYAATSRATASLPGDLAASAAALRSLARMIPSMTQELAAIGLTLSRVDGHLVDVNANGLVRLSNLLKVSDLLGSGLSSGVTR